MRLASLGVAAVVSLAACTDVRGPTDVQAPEGAEYSVRSLSPLVQVATVKGHTLTLDGATRTVTTDDGKRLTLTYAQYLRIRDGLLLIQRVDARIEKQKKNPKFAELLLGPRVADVAAYRVRGVTSSNSIQAQSSERVSTSRAIDWGELGQPANSIYEGFTCAEIITVLTAKTQLYYEAKSDFLEQYYDVANGVLGMILGSPEGDPNDVDVGPLTDQMNFAYLEYLYAIMKGLEIELNYLAGVSNYNNCIWGPPEYVIKEPPAGSGSASDCPQHYVYIEVSYNGGQTWTVVWEGYVQVCPDEGL